jgi:hypothetical protein
VSSISTPYPQITQIAQIRVKAREPKCQEKGRKTGELKTLANKKDVRYQSLAKV